MTQSTVKNKDKSSVFDINKLSGSDIVHLREVLGINNDNHDNVQLYADDEDFSY